MTGLLAIVVVELMMVYLKLSKVEMQLRSATDKLSRLCGQMSDMDDVIVRIMFAICEVSGEKRK